VPNSESGHLPPLSGQSSLGLTDQIDLVPEISPTLDALEEFAQFVDELYDVPKPNAIAWEGNPNRVAIRSVGRLLCKWRHAVKPNRPPSVLIVRLSRKLPNVLSDVSERPKRILQRRRAMEPLNRLRELDSNCVRWLTRQPGITLAEKSGHRRSILAVQRYESVDTLENRVVLDLLRRCTVLASNYLRQHQQRFPNHAWIRMTADFLALCRRLQTLPHLREVSGLPSLPKRNYVLLHESRYQKIWHAYTEVIRQQRRRQQLWTWRHRAFADMAVVALMNSAGRMLKQRDERKAGHRVDVHLRETPLRGQFFDWGRSPPPLWNLSERSSFFVGPSDCEQPWSSNIHTKLAEDASLAFCVVIRRKSSTKVYGLRAHFADDPNNRSVHAEVRADQVLLQVIDLSYSTSQRLENDDFLVPLAMLGKPHCFDTFVERWFST